MKTKATIMAPHACERPIGCVFWSTCEASAIPSAMAGITRGRKTMAFISANIPVPPKALRSFLIPKETTAKTAPISMAVIPCEKEIGFILLIIQEDSVIPIAIAGRTSTSPMAALITPPQLIPLKAFIILFMAGLSALNPAPINISVRACAIPMGLILLIIHEESVMPMAMAGSTMTNPKEALMTPPQPIPPNPLIILFMAGLRALNPTPINMAVNACVIPIGLILLIIQEEAVRATAISTIAAEVMAASLRVSLSAAILANALERTRSAKESPITVRKFIPPTSLNAIPMASTATAIKSMVPIPLFISLSRFLSPPTRSMSVFLPAEDFLESAMMVSWFLSIFLVSLASSWTPTCISFICLTKSPPLSASDVAEELSLDLLRRADAISSSAWPKLLSASNNF